MVNEMVKWLTKWLCRQLFNDGLQFFFYCITISFELQEILFLLGIIVIIKNTVFICILTLLHIAFLVTKPYFLQELTKDVQGTFR